MGKLKKRSLFLWLYLTHGYGYVCVVVAQRENGWPDSVHHFLNQFDCERVFALSA